MGRILIVDADQAVLLALAAGFGAAKHTVQTAPDGVKAWHAALDFHPDVIVSELQLPVLDGYRLLWRCKSHERLGTARFVVHTSSFDRPEDEQLLLALGADAVVAKSSSSAALLDRVAELLARPREAQGEAPRNLDIGALSQVVASITARKRTEAALHESEERRRLAMAAARLGTWEIDLVTGRQHWSDGYAELYGRSNDFCPAGEAEFFELVHPDDRAEMYRSFGRALEDDVPYACEFRVLWPDGTTHWHATFGRAQRDAQGRPVRMLGVGMDVSERKRAEEAHQQLEAQLRQSQKLEAVGTLAGGIAHDFNNLLSAIAGNTTLAMSDLADDHPVHESLREILGATQRGKDLVERILTFSSPQEHRLAPVRLTPTLHEVVKLLRPTIPAGVRLTLNADETVPLVRADPAQVHQLAVNLVANAWHALQGQSGEIRINVASCRVDSTLCAVHPELRPGPHVRVSFTDTGCGMAGSTLSRIFEPFFTTKPAGLGTGLGLSVAHGIMRSHGGAISVDSQLGHGTTFHLYFPALDTDAAAADTEVLPPPVSLGRGEHILYIDDERALVRLTERLFRRLNYRISGCTRADEALMQFAAQPAEYDLVITDFNMPGMSGMDIAKELLKIRPDVPIVLVSGYLRAAEMEQARALGIREVLTKPSAVQDLVTVVHRLLSGSPPCG